MLEETRSDFAADAAPFAHVGTRQQLTLLGLQTRFLYPFFFDGRRVGDAVGALEALSIGEREGVWAAAQPHMLYRDEILDHVADFLYPGEERSDRCAYLSVPDRVLNAWFQGALVELRRGQQRSLEMVWDRGIELFLLGQGIGVLSIALAPPTEGLTTSVALEFNYRLAQLSTRRSAKIRLPHPQEDAEKWAKVPLAAQQKMSPPPKDDAPFVARLGVRGGTFSLDELVGELLRPLDAYGRRGVQEQFSVYTVARLDATANFERPDVRQQVGPFLSALAEIEEPSHAGSPADGLGVTNAILNRRHWAAVGLYGAAHVVADQEPPAGSDSHPFNTERVPRARDKAFTPFLIAQVQRLFLQRCMQEAGELSLLPPDQAANGLARQRIELLQFGVGGHFTHVSSRQSQHRFYQVALKGMDVPLGWKEVRRGLADLDARFAAERDSQLLDQLVRLTKDVQQNIHQVASVQRVMHVIEYLVGAAYFAEIWHLVAGPGDGHGGTHWGLLLAAIVGLGFVEVVNRIVERRWPLLDFILLGFRTLTGRSGAALSTTEPPRPGGQP